MKDILVAVAGSTPQIVTESLYDFIVQKKINISELHIITTLHGKEKCDKMLFAPDGYFYKFCDDYNIPTYEISLNLKVIGNGPENELEDIRNESDNKIAADFINRYIFQLSQKKDTRIRATIAGGRKTMSVYLASAMQIHARKSDRLYHVLISPPELEFNPHFFYPPPGAGAWLELPGRDNQKVKIQKSKIKIENAEIPFLRLKDHLNFMRDISDVSFEDLVKISQNEFDKVFRPKVEINIEEQLVHVSWPYQSWSIHLKPVDLAFYCYLTDLKKIVNSKDNPHAEYIEKFYEQIRPGYGDLPAFNREDLVDSRSRINKAFRDGITNVHIYEQVKIQSTQLDRVATYSIKTQS
ncbi:MAG: CRISPR-associated ring nuclease Csm6 [Calditrichaceae bacterium]